jgi:diaminohydroxyphosphoribosylaminopyrimidine deaminase/5-amino-6-(5-phosphoribosylamino)uracil reductase
VEVVSGMLSDEARWLNRGFLKVFEEGRPWITLKAAMSLDGDVALSDGSSRWITGLSSLKRSHLLRAEADAVLVGIGTILKDDPELTVRYVDGEHPLKIILDTHLRIPINAKVFKEGDVLVVTSKGSSPQKVEEIISRGAGVMEIPTDSRGLLDIKEMVYKLPSMDVHYLLVEGGPNVLSSFFDAKLFDEMALFYAPKIMGRGKGAFSGLSLMSMSQIPIGRIRDMKKLDDDLFLEVDM